MRLSRLPLATLIACGLAACGSSANSASSGGPVATVTKTATVTGSSSPSSSPTSTPAGSASTTSASASGSAWPPCRASGLNLSFLGQQGATGHGELGFALRNSGSERCSTVGYPGIQFLDRSGATLPTVPTHTTHDFFGSASIASLTIGPGESVSFRLGVTHGAGSSAGCGTAYGLRVIPPNDTATLAVKIPDGAYQCETATVSPLRPGDSAYP